MALFTLADLTTPATREDVQSAIYRALGLLGVNTTAWGSGQVVRTMVVATSVVLSALSQLQARIAAAGFAELSTGEWLTLVARYVYGVERFEATFASGNVVITNGGGGVYVVDAGDWTVANAVSGKTYRNTAAFTLPGGVGQQVTVPVAAVEGGSDSTAAAGELTVQVTTLLNTTCTNLSVLVGLDAEEDAALRLRCREKLGALSPNGPWDAYAYAARNSMRAVPDSTVRITTGITRTRVTRDGYGNVTLTVANASGAVTGSIGDEATDLGAVDAAVQKQAAPLAVNAIVQSATAVPVTVQATIYCYTSARLTNAQILELVDDALAVFFQVQPIGGNTLTANATTGKVYADAVRRCIGAVLPQIFHVDLTLPAGDVTLTYAQVATYMGLVGTVTQVVPAEGSVAA